MNASLSKHKLTYFDPFLKWQRISDCHCLLSKASLNANVNIPDELLSPIKRNALHCCDCSSDDCMYCYH